MQHNFELEGVSDNACFYAQVDLRGRSAWIHLLGIHAATLALVLVLRGDAEESGRAILSQDKFF